MERNNDVFTVRIIFNNCVKDIIMVSIGANNKASLHPLVFFLQFKFSPFITITVCNSFPVKLRRHMTLALEKKNKNNIKTLEDNAEPDREDTGMPAVSDNKREGPNPEDGRNSPPSCRPCRISCP